MCGDSIRDCLYTVFKSHSPLFARILQHQLSALYQFCMITTTEQRSNMINNVMKINAENRMIKRDCTDVQEIYFRNIHGNISAVAYIHIIIFKKYTHTTTSAECGKSPCLCPFYSAKLIFDSYFYSYFYCLFTVIFIGSFMFFLFSPLSFFK